MSMDRAFCRRGAAELKARSPSPKRMRSINRSEFVAKLRFVFPQIATTLNLGRANVRDPALPTTMYTVHGKMFIESSYFYCNVRLSLFSVTHMGGSM